MSDTPTPRTENDEISMYLFGRKCDSQSVGELQSRLWHKVQQLEREVAVLKAENERLRKDMTDSKRVRSGSGSGSR